MSLLWNRHAAIIISNKETGEGFRSENLRIGFDIDKTSSSSANTGKIQIYNLSPSNRAILQQQKEKLSIILEIGYLDNFDQLFIGNIEKATTKKDKMDIITEIEAKDGGLAIQDIHLNKSYKEGTDLKAVAIDALNTMKDKAGVVINSLSLGNLKNEVLQNGMSVSDLASNILDNITKKQGLEFSIQDNEIQIIPLNSSTTDEAILLTPSTGLIGMPIEREEGVEFKALIQTTKLRPGRLIKILTDNFEGIFVIQKAKILGDTHDNPWYIQGEAGNVNG